MLLDQMLKISYVSSMLSPASSMTTTLLESLENTNIDVYNFMVFYIVGLGLGSPEDITVRGINAIKASD